MRKTVVPLLALVLAACAPSDRLAGTPEGYEPKCDARGTDAFIGRKATSELGALIQRHTRAEIFNWIAPDMIVTADYRVNRVRVTYDETLTVTGIRCG